MMSSRHDERQRHPRLVRRRFSRQPRRSRRPHQDAEIEAAPPAAIPLPEPSDMDRVACPRRHVRRMPPRLRTRGRDRSTGLLRSAGSPVRSRISAAANDWRRPPPVGIPEHWPAVRSEYERRGSCSQSVIMPLSLFSYSYHAREREPSALSRMRALVSISLSS
jgi:hypothetical protein